jgi:hypothetical protein
MRTSPLSFRLTLLLSLYVAEGLPSGLCTEALPAILRSYGVPAKYIGLTGMLLLPWAWKFLWAPHVDAVYSPRLGQRRSWILPTQLGGVLTLFTVSFFDPHRLLAGAGIPLFVGLMLLVNTLAATHDIATDGLSVRTLGLHERGLGNGVQVAGYRLGLIGGGGMRLFSMGHWGWQASFMALATLLLLLLLPILLYREPPPVSVPAAHKLPYRQIFTSFFDRPGLRGWLVVLLLCKAGESLGSAMTKPLFVDMGYTLAQIGVMVSIVGCAATLTGALLGGYLVRHIGRYRAILGFYALQGLAMMAYGWLAWRHEAGAPLPTALVYGINAFEHLASGMATAAILTAIMDRCRPHHAGSDFTVQVSLMTLGGGLLYLFSGLLKDAVGYPLFFLGAGLLTVGLLIPIAGFCRRIPGMLDPALAADGLLRENAEP